VKLPILILPLLISAICAAQVPCSLASLNATAEQVRSLQKQLEMVPVGEMETTVPLPASIGLDKLKDALSSFADEALTCATLSADPDVLQARFAQLLNANQPDTSSNSAAENTASPYGRELIVHVKRPSNMPKLLEVEFSFGVECGDDHLLLVYAPTDQGWKEEIRWQAPPLKEVSGSFGDFFVYAVLPPSAGDEQHLMRLVAAHGKPWCTSRFSGFGIDVLSPGPAAKSPNILWHTERGYSRGDFEPTLKASGDTFELRINNIPMDVEEYERRVIYRYRIDDKQQAHRVEPIAANARGFVEEWLSEPWSESAGFSAPDATSDLKQIHEQFQTDAKTFESEFVLHSYGPVRACRATGTFQIQINSILKRIVPGKPGGDSTPQPAHYFHVRETKGGYLMLSAPTAPNPACTGANLMPKPG
jgi:hypothetical protein